ncbi:MAG: hypothetical protein PHD15_02610 [Clostridia bacterium]|nr:hypothetical protein [Clostridia bacterium]MDD4386639.1 hypothetical protein [Clostridia bacterium]
MDTNKDKEVKKNLADLAEDAALGRKKMTDESQEGYNFMGTSHCWTTEDEQEAKVKQIEKATKEHVDHVNTNDNNNKGRMNLQIHDL